MANPFDGGSQAASLRKSRMKGADLCTYYVPGRGDLSGSAGLERVKIGLNTDGAAPEQFDSRRLHHF